MNAKILISFALLSLLFSCKKKEEVPALSEKQRLILGKWKQNQVILVSSGENVLSDCEKNNPTIFEFRTDGKCYVSNSACSIESRINPYAISADGTIIVIEGVIYNIETLTNTDFTFTLNSSTGSPVVRQNWKKAE